MLIDVHTHPLLPGYLNAVALESGKSGIAGAEHEPWSPDRHLEVMDEYGIDGCVGSLPALDKVLTGKVGRARARALNEEMAGLTGHSSNRFGAFAVVPMDDADAALKEIEYALDVLGFDGVSASPRFEYEYLGDPRFDPWLAELDRRGAVLFVHPGMPPAFDPEKSRLFPAILEFMFETTRAMVNMVLSGAKERYPNIKYIATHGGGTLPYLVDRVAFGGSLPFVYKNGPRYSSQEIGELLSSFYFDTAAATSDVALGALRSLVPAQQILMGFDFPLMPSSAIAPAKAALDRTTIFTAEEKEAINSGNALDLFTRFAAAR